MKTVRIFLTLIYTIAAGAGDAAYAQTLYHAWHLKMSDIQARSRVAFLRGERRHDAQGGVQVRGVLAAREGSGAQPEQVFFDIDFTTTLLRGTEYDPDFLRATFAAGYRRRRTSYTVELYGEHLRRMNTDRVGRRNANFFGAAFSDPEFDLNRFGSKRRTHGRIAGGAIVNENGFNSDARYTAAFRHDFHQFNGRTGKFPLPHGQIFIEAQVDAIDAPGGLMTDLEAGIRFLFFPAADNSLSVAAKFYDSKNPLGHDEDGIRLELDLEGGHSGEMFKTFLGNTAGEFVIGGFGEDIATELAADFDMVRFPWRGREVLIVLDTLQKATWGSLNKAEYNIQSGVETALDGLTAGLHLDHRSTHGLDRGLPEKNYNIIRLSIKSPGWDPGREAETLNRISGHFSFGNYVENSFKKSRDWDARAGIRLDGSAHKLHRWDTVPYVKGTARNATDHGQTSELTAELGMRFNGNSVFARWSQDAYFGEGGFGGLALRF